MSFSTPSVRSLGFVKCAFRSEAWLLRGFLLFAMLGTSQALTAPYQECHKIFQGIINGSRSVGSINNDSIWDSGLIYTGPLRGLSSGHSRYSLITPTFLGCKKICGSGVQLNLPSTTLGLVATWVFPLAILLSLPYESLHHKRFRGTATAILNWLGTPQTSLTATIYNFQLIRDCRRRAKQHNNDPRWTDLLYILSVFNQFDLPSSGLEQDRFMRAIIYGLYRTVSDNNGLVTDNEEVVMTRELLAELAFQLRMHRRRAVIPTMASLATFLLAFVFSVVLSFADVGDNVTVTPLVLGLQFGWLPVLVIFTIVDRNPVSSLRTSQLMSRWLYNVDAIQTHFHGVNSNTATTAAINHTVQANANEALPPQEIIWWRPKQPGEPTTKNPFPIGDFIGQGRRMQYCGLIPAVLKSAEGIDFDGHIASYDKCAATVVERLNASRPPFWFSIAAVSLFLVWVQVFMAFMIAYNTPTVGLGCWSGGHLLYGLLSSISWIIQFFAKRPKPWVRLMCHLINCVALCWLIAFTIIVVIGGLNNCACMTNLAGYMNFENDKFYLEYFNVQKYWIVATVIGGLVPVSAFLVAVLGWLDCQHLWAANEEGPARLEMRSRRTDWEWVKYT